MCVLVLAALAGSQLRGGGGVNSKNSQQHITHEMAIPNDIIGCIIGKGGTKIAEIRFVSFNLNSDTFLIIFLS